MGKGRGCIAIRTDDINASSALEIAKGFDVDVDEIDVD